MCTFLNVSNTLHDGVTLGAGARGCTYSAITCLQHLQAACLALTTHITVAGGSNACNAGCAQAFRTSNCTSAGWEVVAALPSVP